MHLNYIRRPSALTRLYQSMGNGEVSFEFHSVHYSYVMVLRDAILDGSAIIRSGAVSSDQRKFTVGGWIGSYW